MADDTPFDDADTPDERLRPPWEDTPDETDADRLPRRRPPPAAGDGDWLGGADLPVFFMALADVSDALARLDARVATATDAVRDGLLARLALTEAAGFLAHAHAWVHPLDLALREAGLTAPAALAALGAGVRALPHTLAQPAGRLGWEDPPFETLPAADQGVTDALALARLLRRLPGGGPHPFGSAAATAATLTALGGGRPDPGRLAAWWDAHAPASPPRRRFGARRGEGRAPRPPLLAGAVATQAWMESGIIDPADPGQALLAAFGRVVRQPPVRNVFGTGLERLPGGRLRRPRCPADAAIRRCRSPRRLGWGGHLAGRLPAPHRRERAQGATRAGPARGRRGEGQGPACPERPPLPVARRPGCTTARAGSDAEGAGGTAQDRAADRDSVAAGVAGGGGGEGGDGTGEFSGVRGVRSAGRPLARGIVIPTERACRRRLPRADGAQFRFVQQHLRQARQQCRTGGCRSHHR